MCTYSSAWPSCRGGKRVEACAPGTSAASARRSGWRNTDHDFRPSCASARGDDQSRVDGARIGFGVTDVTTFLTLENVFTSAMTGNMALLGIALSGGRWTAAAHAFAALVGFTCGAVSGSLLYAATDPRRPGTLEAIRPLLWVEI